MQLHNKAFNALAVIVLFAFLQSASADQAQEAEVAVGGHEHMNHGPSGLTEEECLDLKGAHARVMCLQPIFAAKLGEFTAAEIIEQARQLQGQGKIDDCHHIAHNIGKKLMGFTGSVEAAFNACTHSCIDGCFHGVMQAYVPGLSPEELEMTATMPEKCRTLADASDEGNKEWKYRQCIHGLGHGLVLKYGEDIARSTQTCQELPDSWHQDRCLGGVFMEKLHPFSMLPRDELGDAIPGICAEEEKSGDRKLFAMCLDALGEALTFATGHNMPQAWSLCRKLPSSQQQVCMDAVITEFQGNQRRTREIQ
jgi:hypothetical protein